MNQRESSGGGSRTSSSSRESSLDRRAWEFFHVNAGGIVGQSAIGAANLARAEARLAEAVDAGEVRVEWEYDDDYDDSWMSERERTHRHEWTRCAIVRDAQCNLGRSHTEYLASLSGIVDADRNYRRIVEAELACEVWS